jgi:hypothetical protein
MAGVGGCVNSLRGMDHGVASSAFAGRVNDLIVETQRKRSLTFKNNQLKECSRNMTAGPPAPAWRIICPAGSQSTSIGSDGSFAHSLIEAS